MKKIMFCGGGSAGHVMPNVALIEDLRKDYELVYAGTGGIEKAICSEKNIKFTEFTGVKLVRGKILCNLKIPFTLLKSIKQCKEIIKKEKPDLVFCKGGYVSVPPALAAAKLKIPVITHESDLSLGLANKFIAKKCKRVLTAFPSTAAKIKNGVYTGTPMRKSLFGRNKANAKSDFSLDMRPTILVFGGGGGSAIINSNIRKIAAELAKEYNILHICGKGNAVQSTIYGYKQIEFCEDMGKIYACADFAVSRCGANAASELIALKIPTLFIPLDNRASRGDQVANARFFKDKGLCEVLAEKNLTPQSLKGAIGNLIRNENKIKAALDDYDMRRGNDYIIEEIKSTLRRES